MSLRFPNSHLLVCVCVLRSSCSDCCQKTSCIAECWLASCHSFKSYSVTSPSLHSFTNPESTPIFLVHAISLHCGEHHPIHSLSPFTQSRSFTSRHPVLFKRSPAPTLHSSYIHLPHPHPSTFSTISHLLEHIIIHSSSDNIPCQSCLPRPLTSLPTLLTLALACPQSQQTLLSLTPFLILFVIRCLRT